jgi:CRP/FNR family transcriptional regulator
MTGTLTEFRQELIAGTLRRCHLFAGPPFADLDSIASITVIKSLAKGEYLFHQGRPLQGFYIVRKGAIKLHRVSLAGREQVIRILRPLESFGEEALLAETGYPADAVAVAASEVLLVQKAGVLDLLKHQPELVLCLLRSIHEHFQALVALLDDLTLKDVRTRVAHWLLQHCDRPESTEPQPVRLTTTKRMLASELGTSSETFSRALARLRAQMLIEVNGKSITLLCPLRLAEVLRPTEPLWADASRQADGEFEKDAAVNHKPRFVTSKHGKRCRKPKLLAGTPSAAKAGHAK